MPAIGAAISSIGGAFGAGGFFATTVGRLLLSVAVSALQLALAGKPKQPGIRTSVTQTGGTNPQTFILGTYATAGASVAPMMSHGKVGKTPNAYLTYVIDVSDMPVPALSRIIIDGEYATIGTVEDTYGLPLQGRFNGYAWVKFYDGSQTTASSILTAAYGAAAKRPWLADMIGRGVAYAVLTFRYNREIFTSFPAVRFEVSGIKLYDPRLDTSVGGSGAHRWSNPATWAVTINPIVQVYNILRGITLPDGSRWGGEATAADLPLANWFAQMNKCDLAITLSEGGTQPQFRAGLEVSVDDLPADIIDELMKACGGKVAEIAGYWKCLVGAPDLPVYFFTDDDIIITEGQEFDPFPGLEQTYNGVQATYPDQNNLWEPKDAPPRYDAAYEVLDQNRRLVSQPCQKLFQALFQVHAGTGNGL